MARMLRLCGHSDRQAPTETARSEDTEDVVAMSLIRTKSSSTVRRGRPAGPSCRGGASSLLRLAQPESKRLPGTLDLAEWASRAAAVLMPVTGLHNSFA